MALDDERNTPVQLTLGRTGALSFHRICVFHALDVLLSLVPGSHDLVTAAHASETEICAGAQAEPAFFTAGVGLFHGNDVSDPDIHIIFLP